MGKLDAYLSAVVSTLFADKADGFFRQLFFGRLRRSSLQNTHGKVTKIFPLKKFDATISFHSILLHLLINYLVRNKCR